MKMPVECPPVSEPVAPESVRRHFKPLKFQSVGQIMPYVGTRNTHCRREEPCRRTALDGGHQVVHRGLHSLLEVPPPAGGAAGGGDELAAAGPEGE